MTSQELRATMTRIDTIRLRLPGASEEEVRSLMALVKTELKPVIDNLRESLCTATEPAVILAGTLLVSIYDQVLLPVIHRRVTFH